MFEYLQMPFWFLLTAGSALLLGFYELCIKHAVRGNAVTPVLFFATGTGTLALLLLTLGTGEFERAAVCTRHEAALILVKSLVVAFSWGCGYRAMRDLPISIAAPIRASSPLWTLAGAVLIFGEMPTGMQFVAMGMILAGYGFCNIIGSREGFSWRSPGMLLMAAGTLAGAGSSLYDKYLLNTVGLDRAKMQFHFSLDLAAILGIVFLIGLFRRRRGKFVWRWSIPTTGVLLIAADRLYFYAVGLPDTQISVIAMVRRCSCVVTFAAGAWLFRDVNVRKKALAMLLILAGVILLGLCG